MAKKKKLESKAPVPLTRGQLSRARQEQKRIRNLYTAAAALVTAMVLLIGLAALTTFVLRPNQEVARVNGKVINRATYEKLRRWSLFQAIQNQAIQDQFGQLGGSGAGSGTGATSTAALQQQLRDVEKETVPDPQIVSTLVDAEVLRQQSASEFKINPTRDELKAAAVKDFIPSPTPVPTASPTIDLTPTITSTQTITPTATSSPTAGSPTTTPTITPTLPPVPGAQQTAESVYTRYVNSIDQSTAPQPNSPFCSSGCPDLSEDDYLNLIMDPRVRKDLVIAKLSATSVLTEVEQVSAQHILTTTEEGSKAIRARLDKGEDFTLLANTQSSEQLNNLKNGQPQTGGVLGWFPKEGSNFDQTFVDAAFQVETGKYSQPVKTQFGWHIIKVLERDPKRALDATQIEAEKNKVYDDWFAKAKDAAVIVPRPTPTAVIPTQPAIVEPTAVPGTVPAGGATTSPSGTTGAGGTTVAGTPSVATTPAAGGTPTTALTAQPTSSAGSSTPTGSP